ncbi:MAG: hypothetical protein JOZ48_05355 [Acidobacteriaceae bacterium]|nr:hypothetical protein [Acidobacteriaceae bacterium]
MQGLSAPFKVCVSALLGLCLLTTIQPSLCQAQTTVTSGVVGPVGIAATQDQLLVSDYTCTHVYSVGSEGDATLFATLPQPAGLAGVTNCETYLAISTGAGGFPTGDVYATQGPNVYQIAPDGSAVTLFTVLPGVSGYVNVHTSITFDNVGSFGNQMIVTSSNGGPSTVYTVNSSGVATQMTITGTDASGGLIATQVEGPAVAPSTAEPYGGYLFVAAEKVGGIYAISPSGALSALIPVGGSPETVLFVPAPGSAQCGGQKCDKCGKCDKDKCDKDKCDKDKCDKDKCDKDKCDKCDKDKCDKCDKDKCDKCDKDKCDKCDKCDKDKCDRDKCDKDKCDKDKCCDKCPKACTFDSTGLQYFQAELSKGEVVGFPSSQLADFVGYALVPDENSNTIYAVSFPSLTVSVFATDTATAPFFHEGGAIVNCCPRFKKKCQKW